MELSAFKSITILFAHNSKDNYNYFSGVLAAEVRVVCDAVCLVHDNDDSGKSSKL